MIEGDSGPMFTLRSLLTSVGRKYSSEDIMRTKSPMFTDNQNPETCALTGKWLNYSATEGYKLLLICNDFLEMTDYTDREQIVVVRGQGKGRRWL